jgi:hypothetical protein
MTAEEFSDIGKKLVGARPGWQRRLGLKLGKEQATISRYAAGSLSIPHTVAVALEALLGRIHHPK